MMWRSIEFCCLFLYCGGIEKEGLYCQLIIELIKERFQMASSKKYVVLQPYRSELPDYLIGIIDQITKADQHQVLRYDFLHYPLEELVYTDPDSRELVWLFSDPQGQSHLLSKHPHPLFPPRQASLSPQGPLKLEQMSEALLEGLKPKCTNILSNQLQLQQVESIGGVRMFCIEQVRVKSEANLYTNPLQLESDLKTVIAWNQLFRASSLKTFTYLSALYEKIVTIIVKKDLFRRFYEIKQNDLLRLTKYETQYQTTSTKWPVIPSSFREYEEIDRYVPTPPQRAPMINQRLLSKKVPVQCGDDCVCVAEELPVGKGFCKFSLINGWESECPNRVRKVECEHGEEVVQRRCKNSSIRNHNYKRCVGKKMEGEAQIEERLTWGIDLFTRNIIYHCLPELDIEATVRTLPNEAHRNHFIEHTLARAMNFIGNHGYSLFETCNYIKAHSEHNRNSHHGEKEGEGKEGAQEEAPKEVPMREANEQLFSQRDYLYADLLIRNYELAQDKSGFRFHTKGKGAICVEEGGMEEGSFIVQYFGEIYEPWRWYDREDFIKEVLKKKKLKNYIPEFYNIYLEKHQDEPLGYDILVVDPSRMGNFSSRFSHSCDPNCGTVITVSQGRYYIGMYAFRAIEYGEELTFDYCSMTESSYEHLNSICLCGKGRCRGNYLQLSNSKIFNNLMDNRNCFYTRNSAVLRSTGDVTPADLQKCADHNIKSGFLQDTPQWLIRWMARVLAFVEEEGEIYKQSLIEQWRRAYPWDNSEPGEEKEKKIELYSETSRQDLVLLRFQNLVTSVDKLKYFFSRNEHNTLPPIFIEHPPVVLEVLLTRDDSVLLELQESLIKFKSEALAKDIQTFLDRIALTPAAADKLFLFRLCCLTVSHKLLFLADPTFSHELLSDISYFYSFTHTYFSPNEYKAFEADQIVVTLSDILGEKASSNERKDRSRKRYSSPFVWGQVASWFKQTIVCPQASLSQDRRGTLSYPLIKSIMKSEYPYEKQSRAYFHRVLLEKPANSWPPAQGCDLSFKNPYKLYGTLLFQNVHNRQLFAGKLPHEGLLESCLATINEPFRTKLQLFKLVQEILHKTAADSQLYSIIGEVEMDLEANVPLSVRNANKGGVGMPRKQIKKDSDESN